MAHYLANYFTPKESTIPPLMVTLFKEVRPEIQIFIMMRIREDGSLEVTGRDIGKLVEELQGKNEYEYFLWVAADAKEILKKKLQIQNPDIQNDSDLLRWFEVHYAGNKAFSEITALLKKLEVKHDVSFW
jgi:hypothetical protein